MMDRGLVKGSAESRRRFVTGEGEGGEGIRFDAQWTPAGTPAGGHQLGQSRHPLPCGSGQLYN